MLNKAQKGFHESAVSMAVHILGGVCVLIGEAKKMLYTVYI